MYRSLLLLALLCGIATCTDFEDCGSTAAGVSFTVASCQSPPCKVKSGTKFPISMSFTPDHDIADVTAEVDAIFGKAVIPWPGFDTNGCKYMAGEKCPLKAGENATWTYGVYVNPIYPKGFPINAEFMLKDGENKQACCKIPVIIE